MGFEMEEVIQFTFSMKNDFPQEVIKTLTSKWVFIEFFY